jgi:pimeloyl-ACP methyl ester carboxylesterase
MTWLLLRGLGREQRHWYDFPDRVRSVVAPDRVVLLDLAGMGTERERLPLPSVPWLARDIAQRLVSTNDESGPGTRAPGEQGAWRVIGLSLGGMVALELCWLLSHRVSHAIVINSSGCITPARSRLEPAALSGLARTLLERDAVRREARVLELTSQLPQAQRRSLAQRAAALNAAPRRLALLSQLCAAARFVPPPPGSIAAQLCFLGSREDHLVNAICSRDLAHRYSAPYLEHPWAGHDLPLDDPAWVCESVARVQRRSIRAAAS